MLLLQVVHLNVNITQFFKPLTPQSQQHARALSTLLALTTRQVSNIRVSRQRIRNVLARINPPNLDQPTACLGHCLANNICTLGFTLRTNDVRLSFLLSPLDDEPRPLGVLLGNLLLLDGASELLSEGHVGDGDVFEGDVELRGTLHEVRPDPVGDGFTLGDEFGGVELGDDGFEDFVADGGEDTFVVIGTVGLPRQPLSSFYIGFGKGGYLVDRRQLGNIRPVQNSQRQANHLQILTPRRCRDVARLRADIVDNGSLQPRD